VWRYEQRRGEPKPTKVLYQAEALSQKASSTNPTTWCTRAVAGAKMAAANASEHLWVKPVDGIGFVFTADDPYVFVDLDHCVTDGVIHPTAQRIIDLLDSYLELSPSGTGVHIIVRGQVPVDVGNRTTGPWGGSLEVYDRDRFATMTGAGHGEIASRTPELAHLAGEYLRPAVPERDFDWQREPAAGEGFDGTDDELLECLREDRWFRDLWDGLTVPAGKDGDSDQDFRLCCVLVEYVGDYPQRIERLWAQSALAQRTKYGRTDYRVWTIKRAISAVLRPSVPRHLPDGRKEFKSTQPLATAYGRRSLRQGLSRKRGVQLSPSAWPQEPRR
jgi:putative DNA primase/helicase